MDDVKAITFDVGGTDGCVLNGPAYGKGFGLLQEEVRHCDNDDDLFGNLVTLLQ